MRVQFVVQMQNRPGALADFANALAANGVDIVDIAGGGLGDVGYAIVTTDDEDTTRRILRDSGHHFAEGQAVIVEIEDRPGELATVTERLAAAGINIHGVVLVGRSATTVEIALTVDDPEHARRVLGLEPAVPS
jgi:hypothetical protein